jgi:hypothetical protein
MVHPIPYAPPLACRRTLDAIRNSAEPLRCGFVVNILEPDILTGLKRAQIVQPDGTIWKTLTYRQESIGDATH